MRQTYTHVIAQYQDEIFKKLSERHLSPFDLSDSSNRSQIIAQYYSVLDVLSVIASKEEQIIQEFRHLVKEHLNIKTPYIIFINEIHFFQNCILEVVAEKDLSASLKRLINLFAKINKIIARAYLDEYIEALISVNNLRINSMSEIIKKNIIKYYESHLEWLNNLALAIKNQDAANFPEIDSKLCAFGAWLHDEGKMIIHNNSKYKAIKKLHENLHMYGKNLYAQLDTKDFHLHISYLEKCEFISLGIGTELALIDNILMNDQMIKDPLTNALNRHALAQIFANQYEISLATNNSFILALCDLDFFKNINDNFGHIAGDHLLKAFTRLVKEHLRDSDIVIRYGGEEFILLLPAIRKERGFEIIENIRNHFSQFVMEFNAHKINATISVGMMEITPTSQYHASFLENYLEIVDKELYFAKQNGRNQTCMV